MKNYEMMVALKPLLPDDVRKALHKEMSDYVKASNGVVTDVDVWGKRYLAYNIKGHDEGYYIVYNFQMSADAVAELKRKLGLKNEILRFMISEVEHPELVGKGIKKKELEVEV
ncbi:MAG: 30S ribosomal protein S6 [candidate division WS6 bacterium GW2011_GWF2_39_15]|uniref:Small ribosomal subunit protein bS6 n=1 Tax=candidate division WS6 bacterium GW2011_GWF2_39_15 TaxID=1619100 RepID=A0A0G0MQL6_9BACT|nr:MAG: 30S ribosomal protein S6 [candidate division WS6 bacterium GW2011_GWF2_39_15]